MKTVTRRRTNYLIVAGAVASVAGVSRLVRAQGSLSIAQAMQFVHQSGDRLLATLNGSSDWDEKKRQVQALISETIDIYGIARFALGRFWNAVSNEERDKFVRFFPVVLLGAIGRSLGTYQRMNFTVDRGAQADDCVQVWTTVLRAGDSPRQVGWTIGAIGGAIKIVDIIAEGSSLRITQRNICTSFLAQNNHSIPALIEMLRWQAEAMS